MKNEKVLRIWHDESGVMIEKYINTKKGWKQFAFLEADEFLKSSIRALIRDKSEICVLESKEGNNGIRREVLEKFLTENQDILKKSSKRINDKKETILAHASLHQNCFAGTDY